MPLLTPDAPPERVEAGPVIVRRLRASDAAAIATAVGTSLADLQPWMPWATAEAAERRNQLARVAESDHRWASGLSYTYSVLTADQGILVGEIALHRRVTDAVIEIGYWIAANHGGRGYASAAAEAMTTVALALRGVDRAEIHCDAANRASAAIARKLGYRLDRIEELKPEAPGESGRLMIWIRGRAAPDGPLSGLVSPHQG